MSNNFTQSSSYSHFISVRVYIQQAVSVQVWLTGNAGQLFIEIAVLICFSIVNYVKTQYL